MGLGEFSSGCGVKVRGVPLAGTRTQDQSGRQVGLASLPHQQLLVRVALQEGGRVRRVQRVLERVLGGGVEAFALCTVPSLPPPPRRQPTARLADAAPSPTASSASTGAARPTCGTSKYSDRSMWLAAIAHALVRGVEVAACATAATA